MKMIAFVNACSSSTIINTRMVDLCYPCSRSIQSQTQALTTCIITMIRMMQCARLAATVAKMFYTCRSILNMVLHRLITMAAGMQALLFTILIIMQTFIHRRPRLGKKSEWSAAPQLFIDNTRSPPTSVAWALEEWMTIIQLFRRRTRWMRIITTSASIRSFHRIHLRALVKREQLLRRIWARALEPRAWTLVTILAWEIFTKSLEGWEA